MPGACCAVPCVVLDLLGMNYYPKVCSQTSRSNGKSGIAICKLSAEAVIKKDVVAINNVASTLLRHANLFLTMLSLVQDAGIKDIARDPMKARDFVKERFCLDETEERAAHRFASRIFDSIKAIVPEVMERIHTVLQVSCFCTFVKSFVLAICEYHCH